VTLLYAGKSCFISLTRARRSDTILLVCAKYHCLSKSSEINYEALKELSQVGQLDISDDKDKAAILQGRKGDEERIRFIRKPVEINEFVQKVAKELQQETVGLEQIGCYKEIEYKQIEQHQ
jgi:hypothetical protein